MYAREGFSCCTQCAKDMMESHDMELDFIRDRITEPRMKKGVSESRMSSDLCHNKNYIQHIVSGK